MPLKKIFVNSALNAIKGLSKLQEEFAAIAADRNAYEVAVKNLYTKDMPSFDQWKALQVIPAQEPSPLAKIAKTTKPKSSKNKGLEKIPFRTDGSIDLSAISKDQLLLLDNMARNDPSLIFRATPELGIKPRDSGAEGLFAGRTATGVAPYGDGTNFLGGDNPSLHILRLNSPHSSFSQYDLARPSRSTYSDPSAILNDLQYGLRNGFDQRRLYEFMNDEGLPISKAQIERILLDKGLRFKNNPNTIDEALKGEIGLFDPRNGLETPAVQLLGPKMEPQKIMYSDGGQVDSGAAFGVFPQMKPRRAQQDRTASANAPLSALRGYAAGTAGLPGDIEGLLRSGLSQLPPQLLTAFPALRAFGIGSRADPTPQLPTTDFYNEYLPGANLNQTPTGKAFTSAGNLLGGTGSTSIARLGIKSTAELADLAARIAAEAPRSGSRAAQLGVIKLPGAAGNFLKDNVENSLKGLKTDVPAFDFSEGRNMKQAEGNFIEQNFPGIDQEYSEAFRASGMHSMHYAKNQIPWLKENHPEIIESLLTGKTKDQALNNWIDKQLTRYIKNDMATSSDPIRALAERGVTHAEISPTTYDIGRIRKELGFPEEGMGVSPQAKAWESKSDSFINTVKASDMTDGHYQGVQIKNPWLLKVPPETTVYSLYNGSNSDLGFQHLIDELRNATDLASGLPSNLRLKSSSLQQLSVPQAVERVSQINAWRTAEAIKAEKAGMMGNLSANSRLEDPTTQLSFVDKPGMKWVDIPETTDKIGLNLCTTIGKQGGWCTQGEGLARSYGSGPNRLTTLIDADGRPHAQIKITSGFNIEDPMEAVNDIRGMMSAAEQRKFDKYIGSDEFATYGEFDHEEVLGWLQSNMPKSYKRYLASVSGPPNITEMKPVENTFSSARALEYKSRDPQYQNKITNSTLKFLNSDEWGVVTDLDHFNIVDLKDTHSVQRALKEILDTDLPKDRIDKFNYAVNFNPEANRFMSTRQFSEFLEPPEGFAKGGTVHMDEGGAAFGVFPQMKARRAQQDRTAAANAPLSALRGYAAGTAGLPGDIEGLARAGISQLPPQLLTAFPALRAFGIGSRADPTPQMPTTEFYNEYLPGAQLNETPTGKAFTTAGNLLGGSGSTTLARYGIKSAKAAGQALGPTAVRIGEKYLERQGLMPGVIKAPGGNFLKGDIEDSVRPMKRRATPSIAFSQEEADDLIARGFVRDKSEEGLYFPPDPLNNFIDKKIAPYIRNEMATPDDPLRAMAEKYDVDKPVKLAEVQARIDAFAAKMEQEARDRGVPVEMLTSMRQQMIGLEKEKALVEAREGLHFTPDEQRYQYTPTVNNRKKAGMPIGGMGRSPLARSWENVTDSAFNIDTAGNILKFKDSYEPWLAKVPPETKVYSTSGTLIDRTGFDHLLDELHNATIAHGKQKELDSWLKLAKTPEEVAAARQAFVPSLPANLHIDPADLGKLTMPQAVDHVADINAWRATQKIEANQLLANNAATQVVKEYPEQGLKWVELSKPKLSEVLPEGWSTPVAKGNTLETVSPDGHVVLGNSVPEIVKNIYRRHPNTPGNPEKALEDALKYEGDTMKHCVGGYCPDVLEGRSRIYSLRDSKGQPRVTIEVKAHEGWFTNADGMPDPSGKNKSFHELIDNERSELARQKGGFGYIGESYEDIANRLADQYGLKTDPSIAQIRGFNNKKPADEYLPMVQDFVKSGNWSRVNELQNAGLRKTSLPEMGIPEGYYSREELEELFKRAGVPENNVSGHIRGVGFAQGGLVSNHFDPIKIKQIIAGLDDEYDPENIQQIIAQRESAYA